MIALPTTQVRDTCTYGAVGVVDNDENIPRMCETCFINLLAKTLLYLQHWTDRRTIPRIRRPAGERDAIHAIKQGAWPFDACFDLLRLISSYCPEPPSGRDCCIGITHLLMYIARVILSTLLFCNTTTVASCCRSC